MKRIFLAATAAMSLFAATSAFASGGYVRGNVRMYAGPDYGYPSVFMLNAGSTVVINGCINGWSWCDVDVGDNRGWVPGSYLQEEYGGQLVLVPNYGGQIGIPIIAFVFASYWDDHYRSRPWYGQRERWSHFTPQYRTMSSRGGSGVGVGNSPYGRASGSSDSGHARVSRSPARSHAASTRTSHSAGSSAASAPRRTGASMARSHATGSIGHGQSAQHGVSAPKAPKRATPARAAPDTGGGGEDRSSH